MNFPKLRRTYCKKCVKHTEHAVTQYKAGQRSMRAQGDRRYDRKQAGFGGQTKPIFKKKVRVGCRAVSALSRACGSGAPWERVRGPCRRRRRRSHRPLARARAHRSR